MSKRKLSDKQEAFVHEYVKDFNGTQAALRAGYSPKTADKQAYQLLGNTRVSAAIAKIQNATQSQAIATYEETCRVLTSIMRGNVGDYMGDDGGIDTDKVRTCHPEAVQSMEQRSTLGGNGDTIIITKFRLCDRIRAIERLAKLKGWDQPTKTQVEATVTTGPDLSKLSDSELETMEALMQKAVG